MHLPLQRRFARFSYRLDSDGDLRVHLRLGERLAGEITAHLARQAHAPVLALFRGLLGPAAPRRFGDLAGHLAEAILATIAKQLPVAAAQLTKAAQDPAPGLTLTFAFSFTGGATPASGLPSSPATTIRPGHHHD